MYRTRGGGGGAANENNNIRWITYNDIDEFIQVMTNTTINNTPINTNTSSSLLKNLLSPYIQKYPGIGLLMGKTIMFGNNNNNNTSSKKNSS